MNFLCLVRKVVYSSCKCGKITKYPYLSSMKQFIPTYIVVWSKKLNMTYISHNPQYRTPICLRLSKLNLPRMYIYIYIYIFQVFMSIHPFDICCIFYTHQHLKLCTFYPYSYEDSIYCIKFGGCSASVKYKCMYILKF